MPRKKNKKSNRYYFTKDHEDAIVQYASTKDRELRTKLYIEWIQPAFNEMVDKIVYTYKFSNLPNIDLLREDCKIWLTTILDKYDPNKGSKAFSYFSVIWTEIESWDTGKLKENEKKVLEAVKILLKNSQEIEIFNKKAIYLYLRELTGLNTKQVVNCLNKMRANYRKFKKDWNEGKY